MKRYSGFAFAAVLAVVPLAAVAASWLDSANPTTWNTAGASLPSAPHDTAASDFARCKSVWRDPATAQDRALVAEGWHLFNAYRVYDGTALIDAASGVDGMCRPNGFNEFVFSGATFAGTLAPHLMDSRTDGVLLESRIDTRTSIGATFERYTPSDALCCPSRTTGVTYRVEGKGSTSVVVPLNAATEKNP